MDHETAQLYAARLAKSGIAATPATVRASGPLANIWGIRATAHPESRVYSHRDVFPPQWRHVLDIACVKCGTTAYTALIYNTATGEHEMSCEPCFFGEGTAA